MFLWRISNYTDLTGQGGMRYSARWHTKGRAVIYAAESPAGALNEMLVHFDQKYVPKTFSLLKILVPAEIYSITSKLPRKAWQNDTSITRSIGDNWLSKQTSVLLRVPSIITPETFNMLINPAHPEAAKIKIQKIYEVPFDQRLK